MQIFGEYKLIQGLRLNAPYRCHFDIKYVGVMCALYCVVLLRFHCAVCTHFRKMRKRNTSYSRHGEEISIHTTSNLILMEGHIGLQRVKKRDCHTKSGTVGRFANVKNVFRRHRCLHQRTKQRESTPARDKMFTKAPFRIFSPPLSAQLVLYSVREI